MTSGDAGGAAEESKGEEIPSKAAPQEEENVDPFEFYPEVDILAKFDSEWCDSTQGIKAW